MAELQVEEFLTLLKRSSLLTDTQWETAQKVAKEFQEKRTATSQVSSSHDLAIELVRMGLLTSWQGSQLLKGQTGFVLGNYRLQTPVGKGGMGHVFRASDDKSDRVVAIKVMSRKLTGNQTLVNRFRREIRASTQLNSPHIVRTLDAGRVGKVDFMVMEYVNGDQLDRIINRVTAMPVNIACEIIRQAAIGLQHAHERRMVHRDIKPGNLIVDWSSDGRGTVKVMDMGLVRLGDETDEKNSVTRAGQVMGTPDYMSPEQGWDTATVDLRSDIYSLGCTFFRLLTGRVPFPGDNPLQVLMARCSKDAPSARSIRAEIPEVIDGILRRMTLRDPDHRFQTALEVVDALSPFSAPLTQDALRTVMLESESEESELAVEPAENDPEVQDVGYRQFLKEMDSGAAVDLMLNTNGGQDQALSSTIPVLPNIDVGPATPRNSERDQSNGNAQSNRAIQTKRTAQSMAIVGGGAAVALFVLFMFVNRKPELPPSPSRNVVTPVVEPEQSEIPVVVFTEASPIPVRSGTALTFQPQFDKAPATHDAAGTFQYRLGPNAPRGITIDLQTGMLLWPIPAELAPQEYTIPVECVFVKDSQTHVVGSTKYRVNVEASVVHYTMPQTLPLRFLTGQPISIPMAASPTVERNHGLTYRLGKQTVTGMSVHPATGQFEWTPAEDDAGRHTVTVELCNTRTDEVLATGTVSLIVLPVSLTLALPAFPEQTAKAGEMFELQLIERPKPFIGRVLGFRLHDGSPPGVMIDQRKATLRWQVPASASGRHEIRFAIEALLPEMNLSADSTKETLIVVNIQQPMPTTLIPTQIEIAAAESELRELYKRELGQAKSVAEKAELARQLLDRTDEQTPGPSDFALLNLAAETAEKGKAIDVALAINRRRAERYQSDELSSAKELMAAYRPGNADAAQQDTVIEHALRISATAAAGGQFSDVVVLLQPVSTMLKKSARGTVARQLSDDVLQVISLSDELSKTPGVTDELKSQEVVRILGRWQFVSLFTAKESFSFLQTADPGVALPDSGRSRWTIESNRIRLDSKPAKGVLGIIETIREPSRYIIRLQIASQTTSAILIFGAARDQNLNCHLITLDSSAFGQIATLPVVRTIAKGSTVPVSSSQRWHDIEILVDGDKVSLRMNGSSPGTTQVPDLKPGRLGLLVNLERVNPPPKLDIRNARILLLPDE